jgi:hypothetical protein
MCAAFRLQPLPKSFEFRANRAKFTHLCHRHFLGRSSHDTGHQKLLADINAGASFDYGWDHKGLLMLKPAGAYPFKLFYELSLHSRVRSTPAEPG